MPKAFTVPAEGSEWVAKDGRRLRVRKVSYPTSPVHAYAECDVLNAAPGQRRTTSLGWWRFGTFLTPAAGLEIANGAGQGGKGGEDA